MQVTVLVKCPHDVRAEVQDSSATPDFKEGSSFHIASVNIEFDCDICKGYHTGYKEAKADDSPGLATGIRSGGTAVTGVLNNGKE